MLLALPPRAQGALVAPVWHLARLPGRRGRGRAPDGALQQAAREEGGGARCPQRAPRGGQRVS
eukprot:5412640-Prymnesium_polylepis.1